MMEASKQPHEAKEVTTINLQQVQIDYDPESYDASQSIDLRDVAEAGTVPSPGGSPSLATLRRYATAGYFPFGKSGPALRLPVVRVGNRFRTMPEWVAAFGAAVKRLGARKTG